MAMAGSSCSERVFFPLQGESTGSRVVSQQSR